MVRTFETSEITKLLDVLIGKTEAVGETCEDERRLDNLKTLIDVTNWCLDGLQFAMASGYGRPQYSMAEISYTAQCALDEYGRWIADVLDEQIADRKTEPQSVTYNPTSVNNIWEKPTNPYVPNEQTEPTISKMEQVEDEPQIVKKYDTFCGVPMAEAIEVMQKYKASKNEPQYDFGAYADRLWKIAYERGKREALEQTEPSCDTCKLKDTTEWCKRQGVCRAYQPKDEPQSDARKFLGYDCETCKHKDEEWDSEACDGCCENNDHYEPKDEPQTDCPWK